MRWITIKNYHPIPSTVDCHTANPLPTSLQRDESLMSHQNLSLHPTTVREYMKLWHTLAGVSVCTGLVELEGSVVMEDNMLPLDSTVNQIVGM